MDKLAATTLGELVKKSKGTLCNALGKSMRETLYKAQGIDDCTLQSDKVCKSVSCEINMSQHSWCLFLLCCSCDFKFWLPLTRIIVLPSMTFS
jgi:hypothetical protein